MDRASAIRTRAARVLALAALASAAAAAAAWGYAFTGPRWPDGPIVLQTQLGSAPLSLIDGSESWNRVFESAMATWNSHLSRVELQSVTASSAPVGGLNGFNNAVFSDTVYGMSFGDALAVTITWSIGTRSVETDVLFNSAVSWNSYRGPLRQTSGGVTLHDLRRVSLHELGHVLGLDHPDQAGQSKTALMNSTVGNLDDLSADDIAGAQVLYPPAGPSGPEPLPGARYRLYWQHQSTRQLAAWAMDGTGFVSAPRVEPSAVSDNGWRIVGADDFNGDGHADLFWHHHAAGRLAAWLMNGTRLASVGALSHSTVSDPAWTIRAIADMNGDDHPDLVWQHVRDGWLVVWLMNGTTLVEGRPLSPGRVQDLAWRVVAAADMDADGDSDLVWQHETSGELAVWLMDGTSFVAPGLLSPGSAPDANWKIKAVLDVDGNLSPDFIWHHQVSGSLVVWLMEGLMRLSDHPLTPSSVPPVWQIVGAVSTP